MVLDVCAKQTMQQYYYYQPTLFPQWLNFLESDTGIAPGGENLGKETYPAYALQLYENGGGGQPGAKAVRRRFLFPL